MHPMMERAGLLVRQGELVAAAASDDLPAL
jgi:hypothetical protein